MLSSAARGAPKMLCSPSLSHSRPLRAQGSGAHIPEADIVEEARSLKNRAVGLFGLVAIFASMACSTVYYSVWEKLGKEKRELLRDSVEAVREDQEKVGETFESALEEIRAIYGLDGGELEKRYDRLSSRYESSVERAGELRGRIDRVEEIAADLFAEWERELESITDASLRARSREQLVSTKGRYSKLASALADTEQAMDPVLETFRNQVLFLKHNLNAQAIGRLGGEMTEIESEVGGLIAELQVSIRAADSFIRSLPE